MRERERQTGRVKKDLTVPWMYPAMPRGNKMDDGMDRDKDSLRERERKRTTDRQEE